MKTNRLLSVALGLAALAVLPMQAETKSPYTVDFETAINTSNHSFKVASNWKHIVDSYNDGYNDYYMNYSYKSSGGVDGSGCLYAPKQEAGDNWDKGEVKDVLVTPTVSGKISFDIKAYSTSGFFVEIYEIKADGTLGSRLVRKTTSDGLNTSEFKTVEYTPTAAEGEIVLTNDHFIGLVDADINENALQPFSASTPAFSAIVKSAGATPLTSAKFKIQETPTGIDDIAVDELNENDVIYNLQGVRVTAPTAGIYIVNGKKVIIR